MDILIKGMRMPKSCSSCRMNYLRYGSLSAGFFTHECKFLPNLILSSTVEEYNERHLSCPLVEVPPHGDLKDWEKIKEIFSKYLPKVDDDTNALLCEIMTDIGMNAPTVIEAST